MAGAERESGADRASSPAGKPTDRLTTRSPLSSSPSCSFLPTSLHVVTTWGQLPSVTPSSLSLHRVTSHIWNQGIPAAGAGPCHGLARWAASGALAPPSRPTGPPAPPSASLQPRPPGHLHMSVGISRNTARHLHPQTPSSWVSPSSLNQSESLGVLLDLSLVPSSTSDRAAAPMALQVSVHSSPPWATLLEAAFHVPFLFQPAVAPTLPQPQGLPRSDLCALSFLWDGSPDCPPRPSHTSHCSVLPAPQAHSHLRAFSVALPTAGCFPRTRWSGHCSDVTPSKVSSLITWLQAGPAVTWP